MKRSLIFSALLLANLLGQSQSVVWVTNLLDGGPGSFRNAVAIAFPFDTVRFQVTGTILITSSTVTYNKNLVIDGPGRDLLLIDGGDLLVPLVATGGSTWINELTILNGRDPFGAQGGGGMGFQGDTLVMQDVRITACSRSSNGGSGVFGAGLYARAQKARIMDCLFDGNSLNPDGTEHGYAQGGGVYLESDTFLMRNCEITENLARGINNTNAVLSYGGGVYADGIGRIENCTITDNQVEGSSSFGSGPATDVVGAGGGLFVNNGSVVTVQGGSISGNSLAVTAEGDPYSWGAGVYVTFSHLTLENVTIADNTMPDWLAFYLPYHGGGVYGKQASLTMTGCTLDGNQAIGGSGVFFDNTSTSFGENFVTIDHTRLRGGHAQSGPGANASGSIFIEQVATVRILDSEMSNNADAGLRSRSPDLRVERCLFAENGDGGASLVGPGVGVFVNSTFEHNTAYWGAGIVADGADVALRNCTFMNDTITGPFTAGRELYMNSSYLSMRNTILGSTVFQPIGAYGDANGSSTFSYGGNICRDNSAVAFLLQPGDMNTTDPQMGTFGDHGGFTHTWSLAANSTSIDHGGADTLSVDQRGFLRDGLSDAGAFEFGGTDPQEILLATTSAGGTVCVNSTITVSVDATSMSPISYQWSLDGVEIAGATTAEYTTTAALGDAGAYTCELTTAGDTITAGPINIAVDVCASIAESAFADLRVWPQPATDDLFISAQGAHFASAQLLDPLGRVVLEQAEQGSALVHLSMTKLAAGSYVLCIMGGNGERTTVSVMKH